MIGEEEDSHLGDFIQDDNVPVPAEAAAQTLLKEQLDEVLDTLTEREQKVLRLRFGMNDGRARTLEEVGKEFDVTRERIRQIEAKALRKLRHPSRSRKLRDYLDKLSGKQCNREKRIQMELSKRLRAVADLVTAGYQVADIGTDHAYIPIFLTETGKTDYAVAMDVNKGPLRKAQENICAYKMEEQIETRLSDGFSALKVQEVQSAVIAGMGGNLVIRILEEGHDVVSCLKECILQPQSEPDKVRAFLLQEGFFFIEEDMVEEDGKYYPMMKVRPPKKSGKKDGIKSEMWNDVQLQYGKLLLEKRHPVLKRYLEREIRIRTDILKSIEKKDSQKIQVRKRQLEEELNIAEKGMEYYAL